MTEEIRAELVATVWRVVARQGAVVRTGDTVVILESMKYGDPGVDGDER